MFFIPIIVAKLKSMHGNINDYRNKTYKDVLYKALMVISTLIISTSFIFLVIV